MRQRRQMKMVLRKRPLHDPDAERDDVAYWLSRPLEERIEAVQILRRQFYDCSQRMQKVIRVYQRPAR
jgi:hypothetical protein